MIIGNIGKHCITNGTVFFVHNFLNSHLNHFFQLLHVGNGVNV